MAKKWGKSAEPDVEQVKTALQRFWGTRGDDFMAEAADACRTLTKAQLRMVEAWIPSAPPGTSSGIKCERARAIVRGVINEKG